MLNQIKADFSSLQTSEKHFAFCVIKQNNSLANLKFMFVAQELA